MKTILTFFILSLFALSACPSKDEKCNSSQLKPYNALLKNSIEHNALKMNSLSQNALSQNALKENSLVRNGLSDPDYRKLIEYTVGCALESDQIIEVDGYTFTGSLGLAPEWADGACDATCQGWVSACLLARVNAKGESVLISLRGNHPGLETSVEEQELFYVYEGSYYGNVFTDVQEFHACLGPDSELERSCGELEGCFYDVAGQCSEVCQDDACLDSTGETHEQVVKVYLSPVCSK